MAERNPFVLGPADHYPPASEARDVHIRGEIEKEQAQISSSQRNRDGMVSRLFSERYEIEAQVARQGHGLSPEERSNLEAQHKRVGGRIREALDAKETTRKREEALDDQVRDHRDAVRAIDRQRDEQHRLCAEESLDDAVSRWTDYQRASQDLRKTAEGRRSLAAQKGTLVAATEEPFGKPTGRGLER